MRHPSVVSRKKPCENAHVKSGGVGRKADAKWIVPLTFDEHQELHQHGQKTFEKKYGINLVEQAKRIEKEWQSWIKQA
jgi:hypothetical protein